MSLPTLYVPGNLVATKWSEPQATLDTYKPIDYIIKWFKGRFPNREGSVSVKATSPADKILIIRAKTGTGKSTVMPAEIYQAYQNEIYKNIAVTQPRVINAITIPTEQVIPHYTKEKLRNQPGKVPLELDINIGYQTGSFRRRPLRGIRYMQIQVLMQQLESMSDEMIMNMYSLIIIDEVHERSMGTDFVLYNLKTFIEANYKNPHCPFLIVTSATFDVMKFADYLLSSIPKSERYKNIIDIKGSNYPKPNKFLNYDSTNYIQSTIDQIIKIHVNNPEDFGVFKLPDDLAKKSNLFDDSEKTISEEDSLKLKEDKDTTFRDILVFVNSQADINKLIKKIDDLNSKHEFFSKYPVLPIGLTSSIVASQSHEYRMLFADINKTSVEVRSGKAGRPSKVVPTRRVILSTNVAETGVTIDTLRYVIDTGWYFSSEFNPIIASDMLVKKPVTQGMSIQRRGRAGRKAPGFTYCLYTEEVYNKLRVDEYPDLIKLDSTRELLSLIIKVVDETSENVNQKLYDLFEINKESEEIVTSFEQAKLKHLISKDKMRPLSKFEQDIAKKEVDILNFDILDIPSADNLHYSLEKLFVLGAINSNCIPTAVGFIMKKIRFISIESIRMILSGYAWEAPIIDLITISAFLNAKKNDIFLKDENKNLVIEKARRRGVFTAYPEGLDYSSEESKSDKKKKEKPKYDSYLDFKTQLLISDEFINYMFIYYYFNKELRKQVSESEESINVDVIDNLKEWCKYNGLEYAKIMDVFNIRDEIIESLAQTGLNPYQNNSKSLMHLLDSFQNLETDTLLDYAKNIKQCIFEGYKLNIAVWDSVQKAYITRKTHIKLNIESSLIYTKYEIHKFGDNNPKYIVYDKLTYLMNGKTNLYEPNISNISVLDGYIVVDPYFDSIMY